MNESLRLGARAGAILAAAAMAAMLSGCAEMSGLGGSSTFACKAPVGVQCNSVSGNYANALQGNTPAPAAQRVAQAPIVVPATLFRSEPKLSSKAEVRDAVVMPLRSPPREMRMWINKWEDQDHDLVDQSYVYMQLDAGHWLVEHARARNRDRYAPLHAVDQGASAPASDAPRAQAPVDFGPSPDRSQVPSN